MLKGSGASRGPYSSEAGQLALLNVEEFLKLALKIFKFLVLLNFQNFLFPLKLPPKFLKFTVITYLKNDGTFKTITK